MTPKPHLTVKNKKTGEKRHYVLDQERIVIGRDHANYIVLDNKAVSRRHAEILREGGQHFIKDFSSNNRTFLNEKKLSSREKTLLSNSDLIQIEDYDLIFQIPVSGEAEDLYETTDSDILEIRMVKKLLKAMDKENAPSLEVLEGPEAGKRFVLEGKSQKAIIGRDPSCEFHINSDVISRKHARIEKHFDTIVLYDLGSKNGTYVNRTKISEKRLEDSDIIQLGTLTLSFRNPLDLSFDLNAPPVKKDEVKTARKEETSPEIEALPQRPGPPARVSGKREGPLPPAISEPMGEPSFPEAENVSEEVAPEEPRFSFSEIALTIFGLAVLIGSLWALVTILK